MSLRPIALLLALPFAASGELATNSPFGAAPAVGRTGGSRQPLELRGVMATDEGTRYCIFDTSRNRSTWAAMLEPVSGFVITAADPAEGRVVVERDGRLSTLVIREGRVLPSTPEGNAPMRAIAFVPQGRRQPGEPRAPRFADQALPSRE